MLGVFSSCKKLLEVTPVTGITQAVAYADSTTTEANINGVYYQLLQSGSIYNGGNYVVFPLLTDEAVVGNSFNPFVLEFASKTVSTANSSVSGMWTNNFKTIYQANSVLEAVPQLTFLSAAKRDQFLGEARFLRAYCYYMASAYFGKVPLATSTDYKVNNQLSRTEVAAVTEFIIAELKAAETLLPSGYKAFNNQRVRASKEAAQALLAKVYLANKDWANAEIYATKVLNSPLFLLQPALANVLVSNSNESIWEMWSSSVSGYQNFSAQSLIPVNAGSAALPATLPSPKLVNSFEAGDLRKTSYLAFQAAGNYWYVNKYKDRTTGTDQAKILRLADLYLVRAEARAHLNKLDIAADDLNKIRNRANLVNTTASGETALLAAIAQERFVELCFEGHRWLDLQRAGAITKLLPLPATEVGNNPNLLPQNQGY